MIWGRKTYPSTHHAPPLAPLQDNFLPGRADDGSYRGRVVALKVAASSGFEFTSHQMHGDTKRLKPGW